MMNLAEYRHRTQRLADFLPWAALVEKGVILNKDGSFQRTARFRGPDLDSATPAELVAITGIAKQSNVADVEFTWRWTPLNEVGAVLYPSSIHYQSTAFFRNYDDGWRLVQGTPHLGQPLDEGLKKAEPAL